MRAAARLTRPDGVTSGPTPLMSGASPRDASAMPEAAGERYCGEPCATLIWARVQKKRRTESIRPAAIFAHDDVVVALPSAPLPPLTELLASAIWYTPMTHHAAVVTTANEWGSRQPVGGSGGEDFGDGVVASLALGTVGNFSDASASYWGCYPENASDSVVDARVRSSCNELSIPAITLSNMGTAPHRVPSRYRGRAGGSDDTAGSVSPESETNRSLAALRSPPPPQPLVPFCGSNDIDLARRVAKKRWALWRGGKR